MSEEPDKESKTEEATPRHLDEAIKKGNTPLSREVGALASIIGIALAAQVLVYTFSDSTASALVALIDRPFEISLATGEDAVMLFITMGIEAAKMMLPALAVLIGVGLAAAFLQNPPRIAYDRIKPDFSRISISKGVQRIFGMHGRIEVLKAIVKFTLLATVSAVFFANFKYGVLNAVLVNPADLVDLLVGKVTELLIIVAAFMSALVAADLLWSRMKWRHDLRMSKQEVKDEMKQAEGDPLVRARQRSLARDRARRRMYAAVPRATLVIANPTHYAIALRYVKGEQAAPVVVAKGVDHIALKIREIADANEIPVVEDRELARSLYDVVVPDKPIPPEFYKAVAEIIMYLMRRSNIARAAAYGPN